MGCQWVRRGRKVTPDNPDARTPITAFKGCDGESRHGIALWMCGDPVGHLSFLFDCMGLFIRSAACRRQDVGTPTPATNSMPRQRLRSIQKQKLQGSGPSSPKSLQSQLHPYPEKRLPLNRLEACSRTTH